jgi:adenine deaminase
VIPATDVAVIKGRIAYVGPNASHTIGPDTRLIEASGRYLVPGLLDGHMHIESGMLTVTEFARAVIPHGTTGMFVDPHEIANVLGLSGVRMMVDEAALQPVHVWVEVPSCVPSAPGFETPGAVLETRDVAEALSWPGVIGLGEMMNYPGVYNSQESPHAEMQATRLAGKVIGGHYASPDLGLPFHGYVAGGAQDDHEGTRLEDALARARQGMKVMLRYGSAWHDVAEQIRAITELKLDPRNFILCTDDSHSETLANEGHIDRVIRFAIRQGLPPVTAIQMATINPAEYFKVSDSVGQIAPGRFADLLLVSSLTEMQVDTVISNGVVIYNQGKILVDRPVMVRPEEAVHSIHLKTALRAADFRLAAPAGARSVIANVIGVIENQAPTRHIRLTLRVQKAEPRIEEHHDLAKVAVIDRHHASGNIQVGLVQGFGLNVPCAIASTVAHDCHQLVVVGTDDEQMAIAANRVAEIGGGQVVCCRGEIIGEVDLPIAGLMSDEPVRIVAEKASSVLNGFRTCGCKLNNPNMQLSLLALVVIPSLRISDVGLVDVNQFTFIPVLE